MHFKVEIPVNMCMCLKQQKSSKLALPPHYLPAKPTCFHWCLESWETSLVLSVVFLNLTL